jgi:DNA topoisomerase IB
MALRQGQEALESAPGGTLRRSDPSGTGVRRRRCGRGFSYLGPDTTVITDPRTLARIKALVIPPAWEDVWICDDPEGHIQAIGTDAAGRRQYRYHDLWREQRDQDKHDRVREFGAALPRIREVVCTHLAGRGLTRDRVLAAAIRLIDLGFFRPGGEEYAGENGTFGLATIRKEHVTLSGGQLVFEYLAKGAKHREQAVAEDQVCAVVQSLRRRRSGGDQLLAYRSAPRWHDVTAADINDYLREVSGGEYTAKDFRTWHATMLAAVGLAVSEAAAGRDAARKRAIARVVREVAGYLGNTPAVARASYIDPRIIELYEDGCTIASVLGDLGKNCDFGDLATRGRAETAVVRLLARNSRPRSYVRPGSVQRSPALSRD